MTGALRDGISGNSIWVELEKPKNDEHAKLQCELANKMLQRIMGSGVELTNKFFYSDRTKRYCFGGYNGYYDCVDNGQWFNLDYFGRDLDV